MYSSLLIGLAISLGAPGPKEAPKKEASIIGEWIGEKFVMSGTEMPAAKGGKGMRFTFKDDGKFTIHGKGEVPESGTYKIDPKKDPSEIDLTSPEGKPPHSTPGIYKVEGDTLTICFTFALGDEKPAQRPTKFDSPKNSDLILMQFKRTKK